MRPSLKSISVFVHALRKAERELAHYALDEEMRRERSLLYQSGWMITSFSALSIVVATAVSSIWTLEVLPKWYVVATTCIFSIFILSSLLLAISAQWLWKRKYPDSPMSCYQYFVDNESEFDEDGVLYKQCELLETVHGSVEKINDRRSVLLRISLLLTSMAIVFLLLAVVVPIMYLSVFRQVEQ